jgi:hypothetical protein
MASTTLTPLAATATITSPFLELAPELRNRIYDYTFTALEKTTPYPHALTRTNKQIRNECRAMYYASIECIEITLRTFAQYNCTKRWLAEEDWSMFPVLPHITLFTYNVDRHRDVTISCRRERITPAHEFPLQLARYEGGYMMECQRRLKATITTYMKSLGIKPNFSNRFALEVDVPKTFTQVIRDGDAWNIRRLEYCTENIPLLRKFKRLAEENQGVEWTKDDLEAVVEWFNVPVRYRERRKRRARS